MKKRLIFNEIIQKIEHKNVLVITGMRQVGKTTLMRQIFDHIGDKPKLWFDLDNPLDQKMFEDIDYKTIYRRLEKMAKKGQGRLFVFIDEIQNFPEITKVIKYLLDHYGVKFIVTGSSNYYLKNLFPESLSGRKFLYVLSPLDFKEILYFKGLIDTKTALLKNLEKALLEKDLYKYKDYELVYDDYLMYGGFPEVVMTEDNKVKQEILKNIFASFFEKDLKLLSDYKDVRELRDLILLLAPRIGSLLDVSKLASELKIDRVKTYAYLEFLQGVFFIKLLPKYSKSIDRSVAGGRKLYFADNGILNIMSRLNDGQIFENAVVAQLAQYGELKFYNKKNREEIDIILGNTAMEIKINPDKKDLSKLEKLSKKLSLDSALLLGKKYSTDKKVLPAVFI
ncbi:MAG: ATP-binding protein [Patescibacteria group bacterium]|nr:ATP-binding protein [Patescibacteria group bacterium]